jgi:hypothetical protein
VFVLLQKLFEEYKLPSSDPEAPNSYSIERDELDIKFENRALRRTKYTTCVAVDPSGEKCLEKPIPLARLCHKHITNVSCSKLLRSHMTDMIDDDGDSGFIV